MEVPAPSRKGGLGPVKLWAVSVLEKNAPEGVEPVEWMLLTNLAVESPEAALEKIQWYGLRFQIEVEPVFVRKSKAKREVKADEH